MRGNVWHFVFVAFSGSSLLCTLCFFISKLQVRYLSETRRLDEHVYGVTTFHLYTIWLVLIVPVCCSTFNLRIHHLHFLSHFLLKVKKEQCAKLTMDFESREHTPECPSRDQAFSNQ